MLLAQAFATISFQDPDKRAYDLQLDHWGVHRKGNESFQDMRARLEANPGPVSRWLDSKHNGFYDNSIEGVHGLDQNEKATSEHIYYFSLSFHATMPFPTDWPPWSIQAIRSFPIPLVGFFRKVLYSIPILKHGVWAIDKVLEPLISRIELSILSSVISLRGLVRWATELVLNSFLHQIKYNVVLPPPGKYLPRQDIIPFMLPTCYAMGGLELTPAQKAILAPKSRRDLNDCDWFQNDGIVNTESMRGPNDDVVKGIRAFPPLEFIDADSVRGVYWHFGTNDAMDHADEIGVFVDKKTVGLISVI